MEFEQWLEPQFIWIIVGIILILLEFIVPGLIIFFFGAGAIFTGVLCMMFDIPVGIQFVIFGLSSIGSLMLLRNKFSAVFHGKVSNGGKEDDFDEIIGQKCKVVVEISTDSPGKIDFRGTNWNAVSDENIPINSTVEITGKDNITFIVKKL